MKPLLLFLFFLLVERAPAQSLDYISVRKSNGKVLKNVYKGSPVLVQLTNGSYLQGPVYAIRSDSLFVTEYDIRNYATNWGTLVKDTIATTIAGVHYKEISRVYLNRRMSFFQRTSGPLLMIGSAGYLALNILNGDLFKPTLANSKNLRKTGIAAGVFGVGYLLNRLLVSDGFSNKRHRILYVNLSH